MRRIVTLALIVALCQACNFNQTLIPLPKPPPIFPATLLTEKEVLERAEYFVQIDGHRFEDVDGFDSFRLAGFVVSHGGELFVITAGHIQKYGKIMGDIEIRFWKDPSVYYAAELLHRSKDYDIAVLKITNKLFRFAGKAAVLGDSDLVEKNDPIISLGHPAGRSWYVSSGKISSLKYRNSNIAVKQIQHSAFGGYGSSGGPLVDANGYVIGMNISMQVADRYDTTSNRINALPSNFIRDYLDRALIKK